MNITEEGIEERITAALRAKQIWLDWAEIFDSWRVVPRTILFMLAHLTISLDTTLVYWYVHLPAHERTGADATAVCSIVTVLSTLFGFALKFYIDNGRMWIPTGATIVRSTSTSTVVEK